MKCLAALSLAVAALLPSAASAQTGIVKAPIFTSAVTRPPGSAATPMIPTPPGVGPSGARAR